ncbi:hypothetical protein BD410DRAFT_782053 [Rickenella mellea]|uniref:Uncharacterized protein n=1 Tax=Rickenella mellea TaxID=50990 RepID=A0A4Y7QKB6_9AGAM|nr:hypothetical protein BD410DRAFT_782053 [Rickenella mellea]
MPGEVKFTPWGIPYLVEFANVSIRSSSSKSSLKEKVKQVLKTPTRCPTCGHHAKNSLKIHQARREKASAIDTSHHPGGLYIQLPHPSEKASLPPRKISEKRLARLRWTIADAVKRAGMSSSPASENLHLVAGDANMPTKTSIPPALFKGTYGQVKDALRDAGLTATPCSELGFEHATQIGTLFVSNSKGGGVELTKLTLWG